MQHPPAWTHCTALEQFRYGGSGKIFSLPLTSELRRVLFHWDKRCCLCLISATLTEAKWLPLVHYPQTFSFSCTPCKGRYWKKTAASSSIPALWLASLCMRPKGLWCMEMIHCTTSASATQGICTTLVIFFLPLRFPGEPQSVASWRVRE